MIKNVAILMGGFSSEKDISFKSGEVIFKNIDKTKLDSNVIELVRGSLCVTTLLLIRHCVRYQRISI